MKRKLKIMLLIATFFVLIISIVFTFIISFDKNDKYSGIKNSLENIFFYLEDDKYDNIDTISDFCKLSLVYDTKYMKKSKNNSYSKYQVLSAIKKVLGNNSNIDFSVSNNEYSFLKTDACVFGNPDVGNVSYDSISQQFYFKNNSDINNVLYVVWDEPFINETNVELTARALMIEKNEDDYSVYNDSKSRNALGVFKTLDSAREFAKKNIDYSLNYQFILEKSNNQLIWKSFRRINNSQDMIID